jgi:hypothetical protein
VLELPLQKAAEYRRTQNVAAISTRNFALAFWSAVLLQPLSVFKHNA